MKQKPIHVEKKLTVHKSPEELYRFWHHLENLPRFMQHVKSVIVLDEKHSHWEVKGPTGKTFQWDAEIVDERSNERISWKTLAGLKNRGTVEFRPAAPDATEITVKIDYCPPGGRLGHVVAQMFDEGPEKHLEEDLRRFKYLMENVLWREWSEASRTTS